MAVVVEIFIACHFRRNVIRGLGRVFPAVAAEHPILEAVRRRDLANLVIEFFRAGKDCALPAHDSERASASGDFAPAFINGYNRLVAVGTGIKPVFTGSLDGECQIRRINFDRVVVIQMPDAHDNCSLRELELDDIVREFEEPDSRLAAHADDRRANMHLGARALVDPQMVADG
jgi:hypothetical protein